MRTTGHPTPLHWAALGLSALAAAGWTSQLFLPWASDGLLSQSTGLDVWTLWRGDLLPDDAAAYAPALLVLPALSVLLLAMLGLPDLLVGPGERDRRVVPHHGRRRRLRHGPRTPPRPQSLPRWPRRRLR